MKTDMSCVVHQKYNLNWGLNQLRVVWIKNFKTSPVEENDVEMTRDGEGETSRDEDDFEKQMRLVNESDKTTVRPSRSQTQVQQLEKEPIPYISNDTSVQLGNHI